MSRGKSVGSFARHLRLRDSHGTWSAWFKAVLTEIAAAALFPPWKARPSASATCTRRTASPGQLDRRPARRMELLLQAARAENHAPGMGPLRAFAEGFALANTAKSV